MNAKQEIKLDEAHNAIVKQNILKIRQTFYFLFKLIIEKVNANNKNNTSNNKIFEQMKMLKEELQKMDENLKYFNRSDKDKIINDRYLEYILYNRFYRINKNFSNINIYYLFIQYFSKRKIFVNNINMTQTNLLKKDKLESNKQDKNMDDNEDKKIENKQKTDIIEIQKYIDEFNLRGKNNNKNDNKVADITIKYIAKNHFIFITKHFVFKLHNEEKNFFDGKINVKVTNRYQNLDNILLLYKISLLLSDQIKFFSYRYKDEENNFIKFMKSFINYIFNYDNILTEKCVFCHKNAIYSSDEKGFLPPYIKYNREKLLNPLPKNVKPDSIFYHPQCVSF